MHPFITTYNKVVVPKLKEHKNYESAYTIPRVSKVVVNVGVGDCVGDSKALEAVIALVKDITGQSPVQVKARKAIAGFKIRENMIVGLKVTLRGERMNDFLMKLINVVLPRTRDFRGLAETCVTADGNLNVGIKDSIIFPEVAQQNLTHGIQVTLVSNAKNRDDSVAFYQALGFVFKNNQDS